MIDPRSDLAVKCRAVSLVRRRRFGVILVTPPAEETICINSTPVEILRQRKVEGALQKSIAIRLMTVRIRCGEVISLRAGDGRAESVIHAIFAAPLDGTGNIAAPWMASPGRKTAAPGALATGTPLLGDDIDHPTHGVGAILGRMRTFCDLNAVD